MSAKHFYKLASAEGIRSAAEMARYLGVTLAQVQLWVHLLHKDTQRAFSERG